MIVGEKHIKGVRNEEKNFMFSIFGAYSGIIGS